MNMDIRNDNKKIFKYAEIEAQDHSKQIRTESSIMSFNHLMQCIDFPITVSFEGETHRFDNGKQAMSFIRHYNVTSVSLRDGTLCVILVDYKIQPLKVFYITNRPEVALIAEKYGVDRIWIDLETIGKEERQKNMDTVKSSHTIDDIKIIKPLLNRSELMVRINRWHEGSVDEVNSVIAAGADIIMLPYWKTLDEVRLFLETVGYRCKTILLLETREAIDIIDDVLMIGGFDEIYIGLNDLHLSYGLTFLFELLSDGTVEMLCEKFKKAGIPYGFGGVAKIGDGLLPAERIIMEHYRLGSTRAILSRSFCDNSGIDSVEEIDYMFKDSMENLREYEMHMADVTQEDFLQNKAEVDRIVDEIVDNIKRAKRNEVLKEDV